MDPITLSALLILGGSAVAAAGGGVASKFLSRIDPSNPQNQTGAVADALKAIQDYGFKPYYRNPQRQNIVYQGTERAVVAQAIQGLSPSLKMDLAGSPQLIEPFLTKFAAMKVSEYQQNPDAVQFGTVAGQWRREPGFMSRWLGLLNTGPRLADLAASHWANKPSTLGGYTRNNILEPALGPLADAPVIKQTLGVLEVGIDVAKEFGLDPATITGGLGAVTRRAGLWAARGANLGDLATAARKANGSMMAAMLGREATVRWAERATRMTSVNDVMDFARFGTADFSSSLAVKIAEADSLPQVMNHLASGMIDGTLSNLPIYGFGTEVTEAGSLLRRAAPMRWNARTWPAAISLTDANQPAHLTAALTEMYKSAGTSLAKATERARGEVDDLLRRAEADGILNAAEVAEQVPIFDRAETLLKSAMTEVAESGRHGITPESFDRAWKQTMGTPFALPKNLFADGLDPAGFGPATRPYLLSQSQYRQPIPTFWQWNQIMAMAKDTSAIGNTARYLGKVFVPNSLDWVTSRVLSPFWLGLRPSQWGKQSIDDGLRLKGSPDTRYGFVQAWKDTGVRNLGFDHVSARILGPAGLPADVKAEYVSSLRAGEEMPGLPDYLAGSAYQREMAGLAPVSREMVDEMQGVKFDPNLWVQHDINAPSAPYALTYRVNNHLLKDPLFAEAVTWSDLNDEDVIQAVIEAWDAPGVREGHALLNAFEPFVADLKKSKNSILLNDKEFPGYRRRIEEALNVRASSAASNAFIGRLVAELPGLPMGLTPDRLVEIGRRLLAADPAISVSKFTSRFAKTLRGILGPGLGDEASAAVSAASSGLRKAEFAALDPERVARAAWAIRLVDEMRGHGDELVELMRMGDVSLSNVRRLIQEGKVGVPHVPGQALLDDGPALGVQEAWERSVHWALGKTGEVVDTVVRRPAWEQTMRVKMAQRRAWAKRWGVPMGEEDIKRAAVRETSRAFFNTVDTRGNRIILDEYLSHYIPYFDAVSRFARTWFRIGMENPVFLAKARALHRWGLTSGVIAEDEQGRLKVHVPISGEEHSILYKALEFTLPKTVLGGVVVPQGAPFGLDFIPGMHPVMLIGVDALTRAHPSLLEFRDTIFKYGAPIGPGESLIDTMVNQVGTGWMKNLLTAAGDEDDLMKAGAWVDAWSYLVATGADPNSETTHDRATKMARINFLTRGLTSFFAPYSGNPMPFGEDIRNRLYELRDTLGYEDGNEQFLIEFGDQAFFYTVGESEAKFRGLGLSKDGTRFYLRHKDLFDKYPHVAGFLAADESVGDVEERMKAYSDQIRRGLRVRLPNAEWLTNAMYRLGNHAFFATVEQLEQQQGAPANDAQRAEIHRRVAVKYPGWEQAIAEQPDSAKLRELAITEMGALLRENPQLLDATPELAGLAALISDYQRLVEAGARAGAGGIESQSAQGARAWLLSRYNQIDAQLGSEPLRAFWDYAFRPLYRNDPIANLLEGAA